MITVNLDKLKEFIRQLYVDAYENGYAKGNWSGKIDEAFTELEAITSTGPKKMEALCTKHDYNHCMEKHSYDNLEGCNYCIKCETIGMRELILQRIQQLANANDKFTVHLMRWEKFTISCAGTDISIQQVRFNELNDEDLLAAFEKISRRTTLSM